MKRTLGDRHIIGAPNNGNVDLTGGVQKEMGLGVMGESVTYESEKHKSVGLTYKTQRSPSQIKPVLPFGMPHGQHQTNGLDDKSLPPFVQIQPSGGMYYNSISPTRQQKYLI